MISSVKVADIGKRVDDTISNLYRIYSSYKNHLSNLLSANRTDLLMKEASFLFRYQYLPIYDDSLASLHIKTAAKYDTQKLVHKTLTAATTDFFRNLKDQYVFLTHIKNNRNLSGLCSKKASDKDIESETYTVNLKDLDLPVSHKYHITFSLREKPDLNDFVLDDKFIKEFIEAGNLLKNSPDIFTPLSRDFYKKLLYIHQDTRLANLNFLLITAQIYDVDSDVLVELFKKGYRALEGRLGNTNTGNSGVRNNSERNNHNKYENFNNSDNSIKGMKQANAAADLAFLYDPSSPVTSKLEKIVTSNNQKLFIEFLKNEKLVDEFINSGHVVNKLPKLFNVGVKHYYNNMIVDPKDTRHANLQLLLMTSKKMGIDPSEVIKIWKDAASNKQSRFRQLFSSLAGSASWFGKAMKNPKISIPFALAVLAMLGAGGYFWRSRGNDQIIQDQDWEPLLPEQYSIRHIPNERLPSGRSDDNIRAEELRLLLNLMNNYLETDKNLEQYLK